MDGKAALATGAARLPNLDWVAAQTEQQFLPLNGSQTSGTSAHRHSPTELSVWFHGRVQLERRQ